MSKHRPYTSSATAAKPKTCSECLNWMKSDKGFGLCVLNPPSIVEKATEFGPLCRYPVTQSDTPACGQGEK